EEERVVPASADRHSIMEKIKRLAVEAGERYDINPSLILAVIKSESGFDPNQISDKGAVGLMQIIPRYTEYTAEQLKDPETNVFTGAKILKDNIKQFGSVKRALEAYNAGGSRVSDGSVPESTHVYVRRTMQNYVSFLMKERISEGYDVAYKKVLRDGSLILVGFVGMPNMIRGNSSVILGNATA
ncbi:Lytic transglycosylase-like, catalytic domain protein, partial [mine drainage metagenome]